jgi:hypothetical protein
MKMLLPIHHRATTATFGTTDADTSDPATACKCAHNKAESGTKDQQTTHQPERQ